MSKRYGDAIYQEYRAFLRGEIVYVYGDYANMRMKELIGKRPYIHSKIREQGTFIFTHCYRKKEESK